MAILFGDEAIRLLREKWPDATALAEEMFAILQSDVPITITSPVTIAPANPTDQPLKLQPPVDAPLNFAIDGGDQNLTLLTPQDLPENGVEPAASSDPTTRVVTIKQIRTDTLTVDDPTDVTFRGVVVAKPYFVRGSRPFADNLSQRGNDSFEWVGATYQIRKAFFTSHATTFTEYQFLFPLYTVGSQLLISGVPNGVIDSASPDLSAAAKVLWQDVNADARYFRTGFEDLARDGEDGDAVIAVLTGLGL